MSGTGDGARFSVESGAFPAPDRVEVVAWDWTMASPFELAIGKVVAFAEGMSARRGLVRSLLESGKLAY